MSEAETGFFETQGDCSMMPDSLQVMHGSSHPHITCLYKTTHKNSAFEM